VPEIPQILDKQQVLIITKDWIGKYIREIAINSKRNEMEAYKQNQIWERSVVADQKLLSMAHLVTLTKSKQQKEEEQRNNQIN